jgi:hypothetical protein
MDGKPVLWAKRRISRSYRHWGGSEMRLFGFTEARGFLPWAVFAFLGMQAFWFPREVPANPAQGQALGKEQVLSRLVTMERGWVENHGQWDEGAAFSAPGYFGITWVTKDGELRHVLNKREDCEKNEKDSREPRALGKLSGKPCPAQSWVVSERWVGGEVQGLRGEEGLGTKVSYFLGNDPQKHRSALPTYRYLSLGEVWPGVEVRLKASQKTVEKLFHVAPGADLGKVQVEMRGVQGLRLTEEGRIVVETGLGEVAFSEPVAWQERDGEKVPVKAAYRLVGKNRYGFAVQGADPSLPLVIDPILQSTYLGGTTWDVGYALAVASSGEVYVAGYTLSSDFPGTTGGAQGSKGGVGWDAFVARLDASLTTLAQSTYLGGSGWDYAYALAISSSGEVYVGGKTDSSDFPGTTGGAQASHAGDNEAFVARLDSNLATLNQSTYLGGSYSDFAYALAVSSSGEVYVAGETQSSNFPNTAGGAQASLAGGSDAFVAKLNSSLTTLNQSTYLGGTGDDLALALAISSSGVVYVAGYTSSSDFPNTAGGAQESHAGNNDAFVAKLNSSLTTLNQSTYLGGTGYDLAWALAIPSWDELYVAGETGSSSFPNTTGGAQPSLAGGSDAFVARFNSSLTQNPQSTYLGGTGEDVAYGLAISSGGDVYVAGLTYSSNFPNTAGAAQERYGGGVKDAFVARLNSSLTANPQSSFLGGTGGDEAYALAIASSGEVYVAGFTLSFDFPGTSGGAQTSYAGDGDAFVCRLTGDLAAVSLYSLTVTKTGTGSGTVTSDPAGIDCGSDCMEWFPKATKVVLTASPEAGSIFAGWSGDCIGKKPVKKLKMKSDRSCTANFALGPDLVVSLVSVTPASVQAGDKASVTYQVTNQGDYTTGKASRVSLVLSPDKMVDLADTFLGNQRIPKLAPGAGVTRSKSVRIGSGVAPGDYYLGAIADPLNSISETDESNNSDTAPLSVQ